MLSLAWQKGLRWLPFLRVSLWGELAEKNQPSVSYKIWVSPIIFPLLQRLQLSPPGIRRINQGCSWCSDKGEGAMLWRNKDTQLGRPSGTLKSRPFPLRGVKSGRKQESSLISFLLWKYLLNSQIWDIEWQCEGTESAAFFLRDLGICLGAVDIPV